MKTIVRTAFAVVLAACWLGTASAADDTAKDKMVRTTETVKEKVTEVKDKIASKLHRGGTMDAATAQRDLKDQGYDPGPADGVIGDQSRTAISNFQRDHGLKVTGKLDRKTTSTLKKAEPASASPATDGRTYRK